LSQAWEAFVSRGIGAVSVKDLARQLDVTRGSFYHHFANRQDLLQELLRYWEEHWTLRVREDVRALDLDPSETLLALARIIRQRGASRYDVRVRAWALEDPAVREIVRQVDEERLEFIRSQFDALGFDQLEAESRARQFLYYETAEPSMLVARSPDLEEKLLLARHALLTERRSTEP
jgi:AcrR family transcriptional regulator